MGAAALLVPLGVGTGLADHQGDTCPPFERLRYDYLVEFNHGGDLFSTVHVVGFTDFRFCLQMRERVLSEEIRFEARGGAYELRLAGEGFDDLFLLRGANNATGWYEHAGIDLVQAIGISDDLRPTIIPGEEPPSLVVLPKLR